MKLPEKELASDVMVNVTGWGAVKVSARGIDSLSERCGKQMGLNNSEFPRSPEHDSKISWERYSVSEIEPHGIQYTIRKKKSISPASHLQ